MSWFDDFDPFKGFGGNKEKDDMNDFSPLTKDYGYTGVDIDPLNPDIHSQEEHEAYGDFDPELKGF